MSGDQHTVIPEQDLLDGPTGVTATAATATEKENPDAQQMVADEPVIDDDGPAGEGASPADRAPELFALEPVPNDTDNAGAPTAPAPVEIVPEHDLPGALEAVLLVVDAPVTEAALATAVGHRAARVRGLLLELAARSTAASSGIELRELGGGWRFYTRDRFAPVVDRFVLDGAQGRLSRAALDTLAVVAYRQPVTRARVAGVRGVNVDGVVRTLMSRGLIEDVGADPDTGGLLYRTTDLFLERLGLSDLSELPSLGPLLPDIEGIDDV
jgi:segregation and condensation protein B